MKCWTNRWRRRALKKSKKNIKLQKRLVELEKSRDDWKSKAKQSRIESKEFQKELEYLKKNE